MSAPQRERALKTPDANSRNRELSLAPARLVQRKCGCGGSCGSCSDEEKKKKIQRRALGDTTPEIPKSVGNILDSPGHALDTDTRASMESRFGRSFADVRVHTDSHAAASARAIDAAAYTSGTHVVFGAGRFEPQTPHGRRLLAHELAHVVQQRNGTALPSGIGPANDEHERAADRIADAVVAQGPVFVPPPVIAPVAERLVRRKREDDMPATAVVEPPRFIVEDDATPGAGQMKRKAFVDELDAAICATSKQEMGRLGRSTDGCPLLEQWRPRIRAMSAKQLEVSLRRWAGEGNEARSARDYIPLVSQRLAQSIRVWGATGQVVGVPPDLMELLGGGKIKVGVGNLLRGAIGGLFRKSRDGAPAPASAAPIALAEGRPLDGGVASRMGAAFGRDFSNVRIHTGADATSAAAQQNARAFTIGSDIAFAGGEYAPGTIVGDALLAHELAHVAQQDGARDDGPLTKSDAATGALEHDADNAAVHAVVSLWPSVRRFAGDLQTNAMPRLKSNLRLQRCSPKPAEMQDYLKTLDSTKTISNEGDSAKRARKLAEEWSKGDTQYILTIRRKILLIQQMLADGPSGDDQEQILNILERSESFELKQILGPDGAIPHSALLDKFTSWKEELWRFYMRRYPEAFPKDVQEKIDDFYNHDEPEPSPPDKKTLDTIEPSSLPFSIVQFGDELPKTAKPDRVETKRDTTRPSKETAQKWVLAVYGNLISKEHAALVDKTSVQHDVEKTAQFEAFLIACMNSSTEKDRTRAREICDAQEQHVQGMFERDTNTINIRDNRATPETMLHEVLHAYADPGVDQLAQFAKEGLTEFFTRRVVQRHGLKSDEKRIYLGGSYALEYNAIQELAIVVGEDLLARVHFKGAVTELCNALGKAKFDAWNHEMEAQSSVPAATAILRGDTPVTVTKDKEGKEEKCK